MAYAPALDLTTLFEVILEFQCCSRKGRKGIGTGGGVEKICANFFVPSPLLRGYPTNKKLYAGTRNFFPTPPPPWDRKWHLLGLSGPPPPFRYILLPSIRFRGLCQMQQVKDDSAIEIAKINCSRPPTRTTISTPGLRPPSVLDSEFTSGCTRSTARAIAPSAGRPTAAVVKQDKSSGGFVDTTQPRSGPQRVRRSSDERPIGTAKGKQIDTEALCQPPPSVPPSTPPLPPPSTWSLGQWGPSAEGVKFAVLFLGHSQALEVRDRDAQSGCPQRPPVGQSAAAHQAPPKPQGGGGVAVSGVLGCPPSAGPSPTATPPHPPDDLSIWGGCGGRMHGPAPPFDTHVPREARGGGLWSALFRSFPRLSATFCNFSASALCLSPLRACWCLVCSPVQKCCPLGLREVWLWPTTKALCQTPQTPLLLFLLFLRGVKVGFCTC